ncbi:cation-dependent mannose-6-phosphate receptor [Elysia marginata]|uniref:Cation-dependent mannose-6-phosphate receptor n=1 Tax=Elysia marginata TaxID=1093978 RepID=A0AAV4HZV3_9GAST|nr:cation-dependent mannose-6-phosphate receptor [Elysia marginata]
MFWASASLVGVLSILVLTSAQGQIKECNYDADTCGCKTDKGYISLNKYADKPLYVLDASMGYEYHWNPCKDFTMGKTTAACIQHLPAGDDYDCGAHKSTKSSAQNGHATFQLDAGDGQRHSTIDCICKENSVDVFEFQGEFPPGTYDFQLSGDSCCPGAAPPPSSGKSEGLSPGSIILIIFMCAVVVYLLGGLGFQIGVRKAKGKESLPHIIFWTSLPGLIKAGFLFTFRCGKDAGYQKI